MSLLICAVLTAAFAAPHAVEEPAAVEPTVAMQADGGPAAVTEAAAPRPADHGPDDDDGHGSEPEPTKCATTPAVGGLGILIALSVLFFRTPTR